MAVRDIIAAFVLGMNPGASAHILQMATRRSARGRRNRAATTLIKRAVRKLSSSSAAPGDGLMVAQRMKAEGLSLGEHCSISPRAVITDPSYVVMGDNVRLSDCHVFGHDGSINMINRMAGTCFDAVDKVEIGSDVFIGHGSIVLPGTRIGDRTIIGAGSVVKGEVEGGFVYAGNPIRPIRTIEEHLALLGDRDRMLPGEWRSLIQQRGCEFDPAFEADLVKIRVKHLLSAA